MPTHVKSFDIVGIAEDVMDFISMIDPSDTPFLSTIGMGKSIHNTTFQWLEDDLRAPAKNAKLEGADAVMTDRDQPEFVENYAQIISEAFQVSGTSDAVKQYGRTTATARELMKTGKLVKMDLEHSLVGEENAGRENESDPDAREMKASFNLIHADTTVDAGNTDISETHVVDALEKLYDTGGSASTLMVKPKDTRKVASWADTGIRRRDIGNQKKLVQVVDVYVSPFGDVKVQMNRRILNTAALIYDTKNWKVRPLQKRGWQSTKLAKTGDSEKHMLLGEFSLWHANQKASARIENLTT